MNDEELRVIISALVLSGLSASLSPIIDKSLVASMAVERADALLKELRKDGE